MQQTVETGLGKGCICRRPRETGQNVSGMQGPNMLGCQDAYIHHNHRYK